ncbi:MAG: YfiR family protein [Gammaproteobacteria bacterium]|nr:YfiR family protein [Gammaproteobacteria bacterium]MBT8134280.1 YfiR family protein [Gammaproteobacteria bacterium]NNJ50306.1 YfiR family protein [Gammaproteobacteria bacterium]
MKTIKNLLLLYAILVAQMPVVAVADNVSEYTIKAGFIYNFAKFTQWPDKSDELKICIFGKDPFGKNIDKIDGKISNGRTIRVIRTQKIDEVRSCHIAFLNIIPPERYLFERALKKIDGTHVLTVSDARNVTEFGVMIGLSINDDKIAFDVNHTMALASDLEISAKLLRLAREVN